MGLGTRSWLLSVALLGAAAGATMAQPPAAETTVVRVPADGLTRDPVLRGAYLALPSIYRVEARFEARALRLANGTVLPIPPAGRTVSETGTGFAVSPDGVIVTAAHVAAPDATSLARSLAGLALAGRGEQPSPEYIRAWVELNRVRAIGVRRLSLRVVTADGTRRELRASLVPNGRSASDDLVLLRLDTGPIPALNLDESMTLGTPVATLGFGSADPEVDRPSDAAVPTVRAGELRRTGPVALQPGGRFTEVSTRVRPGDSGGPAVDADGDVHGVVRWSSARVGGVLVQASRVRILLRRARIAGGEGPAAADFRQGMQQLWNGDLVAAGRSLFDAAQASPQHTLAAAQLRRVDDLRATGVRPEARGWRRGLLLALAAAFALGSAACLSRLMRPLPAPFPRASAPDRPTARPAD